MGLTEEEEREVFRQHQELCKALNLDKSSNNEAWKSFSQAYDSYIFEGEPLHWLGCSVYIACRGSTIPTVGKSNVMIQGNPVHLCRLLQHIHLNVAQFFIKVKKWADVISASEDIVTKLHQVERSFQVSAVIFRKFLPIFEDMFSNLQNDDLTRTPKSKKGKVQPVTIVQILEFTWTLYICVKSTFPDICDDLVNSYHLLLACCDFIFANALLSGRKDLINPGFPEVVMPPRSSNKSDSTAPQVPCIMDSLCSRHDGISVDAKSIKEYHFRKHLRRLFEKKSLKGNITLLSEVLEPQNFESNLRSLTKIYDEYMLSTGDFDERILLGTSVQGTSYDSIVNGSLTSGGGMVDEITAQLEAKRKISDNLTKTPLSGRRYEKLRDVDPGARLDLCEASTSSRTRTALQSIIKELQAAPNAELRKYLDQCKAPPPLEKMINDLGDKLYNKMIEKSEGSISKYSPEMAKYRLEATKKLYYRIVDLILADESKKPSFDPSTLLSLVVFHSSLFACAAEIVIFAFLNRQPFPFVIEALGIAPYDFYRIIEVVVRTDDLLNRDIVKHLNEVEETVLESLAWARGSPMWKALISSGQPVPCCEDVAPMSWQANSSGSTNKLDMLAGRDSVLTRSPGAPLSDKFMSPLPKGMKRRMVETNSSEPPAKLLIQSIEGKDGKKVRRTGSLGLFFRKFYFLASVRLQHLCDQLRLTDADLRQKIWTCFELSVVNHVGLLLDRHLDQLLMCAIYVICKIVKPEQLFTDLMKCYRNQPQARSPVYRNVLLGPVYTLDEISALDLSVKVEEQRGTLIDFYNLVYVITVESIVHKFSTSMVGEAERIVLSPLPPNKSAGTDSPRRRVSERHSIYLRVQQERVGQSPNIPSSPQLSYFFSQSPAKDLKAINNMVNLQAVSRVGKQLLQDDDTENLDIAPAKLGGAFTRKVQHLIVDRLAAQENH